MKTTIVANSSGVAGAIALVRVSGDLAFSLVEKIYRGKVAFESVPCRVATLCEIVHNGEEIDTVLLTKFAAPASFTGEDMVEISCHGGRFVPAQIIEALLDCGARIAQAGEFSKRAFVNGKLDLTQAEGIVDLINAESHSQARAARRLMGGELSDRVQAMYAELVDILAHIEASLDYPDENLDPIDYPLTEARLTRILAQLNGLKASYGTGRVIKDGYRVVLTGRPNVGKSSLFNALTGSNAIVTEIEGTTTDTKTEATVAKGAKILYTDTAGLREARGLIESMGIEQAEKAIESADLILSLQPCTESGESVHYAAPTINVRTKCDLAVSSLPSNTPTEVYVSTVSGWGLDYLREQVEKRAASRDDGFALTGLRHYKAVAEAAQHMEYALSGIHSKSGDLLAVDVRIALERLGDITGKTASTELVNAIFSKFCLGK